MHRSTAPEIPSVPFGGKWDTVFLFYLREKVSFALVLSTKVSARRTLSEETE